VSKLTQLRQRIADLNKIAFEAIQLGKSYSDGEAVRSQLAEKGEEWYRGARAILQRENFSGLAAFDLCYDAIYPDPLDGGKMKRSFLTISYFIHDAPSDEIMRQVYYTYFARAMTKAIALLKACASEVESRELPIQSELSFAVSSDEFDTAQQLLSSSSDVSILRASGVVARVALERHMLTVADSHGITVVKNPPHKAHPDFSDVIVALKKNVIITEVQRSRLETLYKIGNNCAHPKETVRHEDVQELVKDGKALTAVIL